MTATILPFPAGGARTPVLPPAPPAEPPDRDDPDEFWRLVRRAGLTIDGIHECADVELRQAFQHRLARVLASIESELVAEGGAR